MAIDWFDKSSKDEQNKQSGAISDIAFNIGKTLGEQLGDYLEIKKIMSLEEQAKNGNRLRYMYGLKCLEENDIDQAIWAFEKAIEEADK